MNENQTQIAKKRAKEQEEHRLTEKIKNPKKLTEKIAKEKKTT